VYICVCNGVTEQQIRDAIDAGASTLPELRLALGVAAGCGACQNFAADMLDATLKIPSPPQTLATV